MILVFVSGFALSNFYLTEGNINLDGSETWSTEKFIQYQTANADLGGLGFLRNVKAYQCDQCGRSYRRLMHLKAHKRRECGQQPQIKCPICPMKTKRRENLKRHILQIHPNYNFP